MSLPVHSLSVRLAAAILLAVGAVAVLGAPERARAAEETCPSTFHVLHDDRVGALQLPEGHYEITLLDSARLSCSAASSLFAQFLQDYDGKLPRPWRVRPAQSEFRSRGSSVGFRVTRVDNPHGGGGGGRHPATGTACPGFFDVLHNDRIGRLSVPAGKYRITLLSVGRLSCERATSLFKRFLEDFDGNLPGRWRLHRRTATFSRNPHFGFRIKEASGEDPTPNSGGTHPTRGGSRCPGTFRVLHDDHIGALKLPAGNYKITLLQSKGLTCNRASKLFAKFLQRFDGNLPGRWQVDPGTAEFRKGNRGKGFRVKPR